MAPPTQREFIAVQFGESETNAKKP
jgi:hypothetical protein